MLYPVLVSNARSLLPRTGCFIADLLHKKSLPRKAAPLFHQALLPQLVLLFTHLRRIEPIIITVVIQPAMQLQISVLLLACFAILVLAGDKGNLPPKKGHRRSVSITSLPRRWIDSVHAVNVERDAVPERIAA